METIQKKKKSTGRPSQTLKRDLRITARFSKLEQSIVQKRAGKAGMNISEFIRQSSISGKVIARLTDEERHIVRQLIGMANNLNQMMKVANKEGITAIRLVSEAILHQINGFLNKLRHGQ